MTCVSFEALSGSVDAVPWDVSAGCAPHAFLMPSMAKFVRDGSALGLTQVLSCTCHCCPPHLDAVTNAKKEAY